MPHCPDDGTVITRQTPQQIVDRVLELPEGTRFQVLAPVVRGRKGNYDTLLADLATQGFARARIDGEIHELTDKVELARYESHTIEVIVDRLVKRDGIERRLTDSLETALKLADGVAEVQLVPRGTEGDEAGAAETLTFSQHLACPNCGTELRGAGAPQLLVQLALRRVRALRRSRHPLRGRSRAGRAGPRPLARGRRDRPVGRRAPAVLRPPARGGLRGARHPDATSRGGSSRPSSRSCCSTARAPARST